MSELITLQIFTPEKTFLDKQVYRVVLPYGPVNLTIIDGRAPTSLVLPAGKISILNRDNQIEETYFIDGGVVDVAQNVCKLSTRHIIKTTDVNIEQAQMLKNDEPQNEAFYNMIIDELSITENSEKK